MPRVRRRQQIHVAGIPECATDLTRTALALAPDLTGVVPGMSRAPLRATVSADGESDALVVLEADVPIRVPFFQWFFGPVFRWELRRGVKHAIALIEAADKSLPAPPPPARSPLTPPVAFTTEQQALIATVSFAALLASFAAALFGQNADGVAKSF